MEFRGLVENRLDRLRSGVLETGKRGNLCQSGQIPDDKQHVLGGCGIAHLLPLYLEMQRPRLGSLLRCDIDGVIVMSGSAKRITRTGPFADKSCRFPP
ncbi:hypothetical protein D3C86_1758430 [compost metagenome]